MSHEKAKPKMGAPIDALVRRDAKLPVLDRDTAGIAASAPSAPSTTERASAPQSEARGESAPTTRRRVLIVDDNADCADSARLLLGSAGHEVRTVHDGAAALAVAREFRPEVVLLDIGLPDEDGYSVARRMRDELGLTQALIVAVTGFSREENIDLSRQASIDAHLTKPTDASQVLALVLRGK